MKKGVLISGARVNKVNGHNLAFIKNNGIGPGAIVNVIRAGDAIPKIQSVSKKVQPQLPSKTEFPDWVINESGVDAIIKGSSNEVESIVHFFSALNVERFSEGLIKSFYENGYKTIPDILHMTTEDIVSNVPRQGKTSAKNIVAEFTKLKNPGVKLPDLMYASGCFGRGLGKGKFYDLYKEYGDELVSGWSGMQLSDVAASIQDIHGFSYATGKQFALGIKPYLTFYRSVKDVIYIRKQDKLQTGILSGFVITPSDFRDKILGQKIEKLGGVYSESFSGKTTLLLVPTMSSNSTKVQKAKAKGIELMTRGDFVKKYKLE